MEFFPFKMGQKIIKVFLKKVLTRLFFSDILCLASRERNKILQESTVFQDFEVVSGSVGTGRRARLRILWALRSCGFKSHLPHWLTKKDRTLCPVFFSLTEAGANLNPRVQSSLRSGRLKALIPRTSFAPSSAGKVRSKKPQGFNLRSAPVGSKHSSHLHFIYNSVPSSFHL